MDQGGFGGDSFWNDEIYADHEENEQRKDTTCLVKERNRRATPSRGACKGRQGVLPRPKRCRFQGENLLTEVIQSVHPKAKTSFIRLWAKKDDEPLPSRKAQGPEVGFSDAFDTFLESETAGEIEKTGEIEKAWTGPTVEQIGVAKPAHHEGRGFGNEPRSVAQDITLPCGAALEDKDQSAPLAQDAEDFTVRKADSYKPEKPIMDERVKEADVRKQQWPPKDEESKTAIDKYYTPMIGNKEENPVQKPTRIAGRGEPDLNAEQDHKIADGRRIESAPKARTRMEREERVSADTFRTRAAAARERQTVARAKSQTPDKQRRGPAHHSPALGKAEERKAERSTARRFRESNSGAGATPYRPPGGRRPFARYEEREADDWAGGRRWRPAGTGVPDDASARMQREDEASHRRLLEKARFHFEALQRIERAYNQRASNARGEKSLTSVRGRHGSDSPLMDRPSWDNFTRRPGGPREDDRRHLFKKSQQRKGKGGLNALLSPVVEEWNGRHPFDNDESPAESSGSELDKQVTIFRRHKWAQMRAAEEWRAGAEERARQRRAQQRAAVERAERARALAREAGRRDITPARPCSRGCGTYLGKQELRPPARPSSTPHTFSRPSSSLRAAREPAAARVRIKDVNERARSMAGDERERLRRERVNTEERMVRGKRLDSACQSMGVYEKMGTPAMRSHNVVPGGRFRTPLADTRNADGRSKSAQSAPGSRFRTPVRGQLDPGKMNALQHFANWEKELRTDRNKESDDDRRRVTIQENPIQNVESKEDRTLDGSSLIFPPRLHDEECVKNTLSPTRKRSPTNGQSRQPRPDHYNSESAEDGCSCKVRNAKDKHVRRAGVSRDRDVGREAVRRDRHHGQSLKWLGKLMTPFLPSPETH